MSVKPNYFKIGTFVLSALIIVVVGIVMLSGGRWSQKTYWETYFDESVQGLAVGAPIKYRGVQIGTVERIAFVAMNMDLTSTKRTCRDTVAMWWSLGPANVWRLNFPWSRQRRHGPAISWLGSEFVLRRKA